MASRIKFNCLTYDLLRGRHEFGTDVIKCLLCTHNLLVTHAVKADLTEIGAGFGYSAGGVVVPVTLTQTGGVTTLSCTMPTFTPSGGDYPTFLSAVFYNDTSASDRLICGINYTHGVVAVSGTPFVVEADNTILFQISNV